MQNNENDDGGDQSFRKNGNMPMKLTKQQLYSCNPMTVEQNYLINTEIKLNNVISTINNLNINPESPRTKKSLEICNLQFDQLMQKELVDFRIQGELIQFTEKRHQIHQLQIAQLRKQVILQRNKLKHEQRVIKRKAPHNLDQSVSSIQLSEHLKSPTEMIESWIETHFTEHKTSFFKQYKILKIIKTYFRKINLQSYNKSQKYQAKLEKIRQQKEEQEKKEAEQQIQFVQSLNKRTEKKRQKRLLTIQERKERAKEQNSRSIEIQRKVKQVHAENLKKSQVRQEIDRQASINLDKKIDQLKQQFSEQLQQQSQIYQEKQQKAVQIKQESDFNKQIVAKLQLLKTERNIEYIILITIVNLIAIKENF